MLEISSGSSVKGSGSPLPRCLLGRLGASVVIGEASIAVVDCHLGAFDRARCEKWMLILLRVMVEMTYVAYHVTLPRINTSVTYRPAFLSQLLFQIVVSLFGPEVRGDPFFNTIIRQLCVL